MPKELPATAASASTWSLLRTNTGHLLETSYVAATGGTRSSQPGHGGPACDDASVREGLAGLSDQQVEAVAILLAWYGLDLECGMMGGPRGDDLAHPSHLGFTQRNFGMG